MKERFYIRLHTLFKVLPYPEAPGQIFVYLREKTEKNPRKRDSYKERFLRCCPLWAENEEMSSPGFCGYIWAFRLSLQCNFQTKLSTQPPGRVLIFTSECRVGWKLMPKTLPDSLLLFILCFHTAVAWVCKLQLCTVLGWCYTIKPPPDIVRLCQEGIEQVGTL